MAAAGLEKGGIYRHFESKDALALAAFDRAMELHRDRIRSFVNSEASPVRRLAALAHALASVVVEPVLPGGCPLLNTAVESDDGASEVHRALRARTRENMRRLIDFARRTYEDAIASDELPAATNAHAEAELFVATMEGAVMLSKLYDDPRYVRQAAEHLTRHLTSSGKALS
jgi:AcrR family transcriptional regulator